MAKVCPVWYHNVIVSYGKFVFVGIQFSSIGDFESYIYGDKLVIIVIYGDKLVIMRRIL
jgi:hypothetical protein